MTNLKIWHSYIWNVKKKKCVNAQRVDVHDTDKTASRTEVLSIPWSFRDIILLNLEVAVFFFFFAKRNIEQCLLLFKASVDVSVRVSE